MAINVPAASSSTSTVSSMVTDPGMLITITKDEFNMFHNIDRQLFSRLIMNLGWDPTEAMQVMALFLWLEKIGKDSQIVCKLLTWPEHLLNDLINEAIMALSCIKGEIFPFSSAMKDLPLTQKLTRSGVNLIFFHENRHDILPAVIKLLNDVCVRAFDDIIRKVQHKKAAKEEATLGKMIISEAQSLNHPSTTAISPNLFRLESAQQMGYYNQGSQLGPINKPVVAEAGVVPHHHVSEMTTQLMQNQSQVNKGGSCDWSGIEKFNLPYQRDFLNNDLSHQGDLLNNELSELLDGLKLNDGGNNGGKASEVRPDDRTIFVTFSKGYPISESEILDFFTRYGDIIEAVHMQEVAPLEQPLYARLVVRPTAIHMIQVVLEGMTRNKFNINGKHVWARKYVPKNANKSSQVGSLAVSQLDSPTTYH